jgi:uncharacterized membrane protein
MSYEAFKVIHLLGVILFLGNIIVTGVWKVLADRTGEPRTIAYAQRLVTVTDWIFTAGGVALILIGAYGMAAVGHLDLRGPAWLVWGQAMFAASGVTGSSSSFRRKFCKRGRRVHSPRAARSRKVIGSMAGAGSFGEQSLPSFLWLISILWFSSHEH